MLEHCRLSYLATASPRGEPELSLMFFRFDPARAPHTIHRTPHQTRTPSPSAPIIGLSQTLVLTMT